MDKRTFLYIFAMFAALFAVNLYFEQQNQEKLKDWSIQQQAKKEQRVLQLTDEIKSRSVSLKTPPVVELYEDQKGNSPLLRGVKSGDSTVTITSSDTAPDTLYAKTATGFDKLSKVFSEPGKNSVALYSKSKEGKLKSTNLSDFGRYELLLIPTQNMDSTAIPADYADSQLSVPAHKLEQVQAQLDNRLAAPLYIGNSIVLVKNKEGWLPVAIYESITQSILPFDMLENLEPYLSVTSTNFTSTPGVQKEERFYVLENAYQQFVFSTHGGALVEINLPFESKEDKDSVVKEIGFDQQMLQQNPRNARFPLHAYFTANDKNELVEHKEGKLGGYYPLLRRDLIEYGNRKSLHVPPRFYAFNIVSEYPEVAELVYTVKHFDQESIEFEAVQNHRRITKRYSIQHDTPLAPYCLNLTLTIEGDSRGLWITSGVPEVEWISGGPAPALKYRITRNNKADIVPIDLPAETLTVSTLEPDWICNSNGFFGIILDPLSPVETGYRVQMVPGNLLPSRLVEIDQKWDRYKAQDLPGYLMQLPLKSTGGTTQFRIFAGPFADTVLNTVDQTYSDPTTGYNPDYIACQTFHGWFAFISEPFANLLFWLMNIFHSLTGSWGFSIILLTVALRILLYPLNAWSTNSMLKMQMISPKVTSIQEKHKKDPKKAQLEIMNLYREEGVNPLSGCLPLLIQMPFLIGMFDLLKSTFELRGASFIPGWIDDLAAPDVLFSWSTPIFFIGNQFHLLPILLGLVMFLQQKYASTQPTDPSLMTDQQRQQRAMGTMMTVVFSVMFYHFPSGLNIYWLSSMLLGMLQQWWTARGLKLKTK